MEWLDRLSAKKGAVGVEVLREGLAIAAKGCFDKSGDIDLVHVIRQDSEQVDLAKELHHFVHKHKITHRLCHLILPAKDYQLLLVEAPDVPDENLRDAVKWKVKDLISMPIEKAVVDVFRLPPDASKSSKSMVYAVVSHADRIKEIISMVNDAGLKLSSIDINEMAMRNISMVTSSDLQERGVGIVRLGEGDGVVSLYRQGNLYLSRHFRIDYNGGLLDELPVDALALEVQRSLDYYERQMGMPPPAIMYLCGESVSEDKITQELVRSVNVSFNFLPIQGLLDFKADTDEGVIQLCVGALGALHREEVLS